MKIIDLLNKIANGEEIPKKIKVDNRFYYEYDENIDYKSKDGTYLFDAYIQINKKDMNMEVEIIEEDKKIKKLEILDWEEFKIMTAGDKYELYQNIITIMNVFIDCINTSFEDNNLIDKVNSLENK